MTAYRPGSSSGERWPMLSSDYLLGVKDRHMEIAAWLKGLGLERYEPAFHENEIDERVLSGLTAEDLKDLGVVSVGHRRRLLDAIRALSLKVPGTARDPPAHADAERRQLTVMFCDLVGWTELSAWLDLEDLRELIAAYHRAVAEIVARFDGFVAKYMGDGVLAYFGYPRAHEDDAERAVRSGLGLIDAVDHLDVGSVKLHGRVGIATGLVVVGDLIGEGPAQEESAVGETPNLAARLQALAEPGAVVIDAATRRLTGGLFEYADLKPALLRGIAAPVPAAQVLREKAEASRFEALRAASTPFIGRDEELALLAHRWRQAKAGEGRVVLVAGEPGIGKSRLVQTLIERIADEAHTRLRCFCSPHHQDSALHPLITQLECAAGFRRDETAEQRLEKLELLLAQAMDNPDEAAPLLAELLSIPTANRYPPLELTPQMRKGKTLRAFLTRLEGLAARQPVLMLFEDAHWSDPTSIELLDLIVDRTASLRLLLIVTFRPEFAAPWTGRPRVSLLNLNRLPHRDRSAIIASVTGGKSLPKEINEQIIDRTDGVPLFVEELTKAVIESGILADLGDHYAAAGPLQPLAIPATLHGSLLARLDRLASARKVAQIGAALGRHFSHELISAVAAMPQSQVDGALAQLVNAELVYQRGVAPDAKYTFKHALVQDAAYQSMLRGCRVHLHTRIAGLLERSFPELAETEPETLAHHHTAAALPEKAIPYWLAAGRRALHRSAMKEAICQLKAGIGLLAEMHDGAARMELEFELQCALGLAWTAVKGYAAQEVEAAFSRAHTLCLRIGKTAELGQVVRGLALFRWLRGNLLAAKDLVAEFLQSHAPASHDELSMVMHATLGCMLSNLGELPESEAHLKFAHQLVTPQRQLSAVLKFGDDGISMSRNYHAFNLALLGHIDTALADARDAVALARSTGNSLTITSALWLTAVCSVMLRDPVGASSFAEEAMLSARDYGFAHWETNAKLVLGWLTAKRAGERAGVTEIRDAIASRQSSGSVVRLAFFFGLLSETELATGNPNAAVEAANEGLRWGEKTSEDVQTGFLLYARGDAVMALGDYTQAETDYRRALVWSRERNAKWEELNAGIRLARLWQADGDPGRARELLAPIYGWFTEGFNNPVLQDAKTLLEDLTGMFGSAALLASAGFEDE